MAILLHADENLQMSAAILVDKGMAGGMQVQDVRIWLTLWDSGLQEARHPNIMVTTRVMELAGKRFKAYFDALDTPEEGATTYDSFVRGLIAEVNQRFQADGIILRRFILGGWEASVESMAKMMGIELEGAVKH